MPGDRDRILRELRRRRIAIVGLGVSNQALLRFLLARGARQVAAGDMKTADQLGPSTDWLRSVSGVDLRFGDRYLDVLAEADIVFLTPGIRKDLPEIAAARARGATITSEMGLFLQLCRARTVGVTASAGKTTTTALVGEMLFRSGHKVFVGGNIGTPLIERVLDLGPDETVVLELSSFQLQLVDRSPNVGAVLNIAPNHLDVHRDMAEYVSAKKGIYRYQRPGDWAVFGADNAETLTMARERAGMEGGPASGGGPALFGRSEPTGALNGFSVRARGWIEGEHLVAALPKRRGGDGPEPGRLEPVRFCPVAGVRLRGEHNLLNLLAATLVSVLAGGRLEAAQQVAATFETIEHRLELVAEVGGVTFINDSIGTSPDRTEVALAAFPAPIHLILGGYDKKIPFDTLGEIVVRGGKVRKVVLLGQTAPKIRRALEEAMSGLRSPAAPSAGPPSAPTALPLVIAEAATFEDAVQEARSDAVPGTTVLLSPACASFDMFQNFEARGAAFKAAVLRVAQGRPSPTQRS